MEENINVEMKPLFSPDELAVLGFSKDEIDVLYSADALSDTVALLPEENKSEKVIEDMKKYVVIKNDNLEESISEFLQLAETHPDVFTELYALKELVNSVKEEEPATTQKLSADDIKQAQLEEDWQDILKEIETNVGTINA